MTELFGFILAILYLLLATKELRSSWIFYILSSALYFVVFIHAQLYSDALLQIFFVGAGFYGLREWGKSKNQVAINSRPFRFHLPLCVTSAIVAIPVGAYFATISPPAYAYIDAQISVFSVTASYLSAKKIVECWQYWIVIDLVAAILYWSKDLNYTALLFAIYVVLAFIALKTWRLQLKTCPDKNLKSNNLVICGL